MADEVDDFGARARNLIWDLPANPIVDELQDLFEDMAAALRALRKDRERLDWLFGKGPFDGTSKWNGDVLFGSYFNRDQVDAAMAAESARGDAA